MTRSLLIWPSRPTPSRTWSSSCVSTRPDRRRGRTRSGTRPPLLSHLPELAGETAGRTGRAVGAVLAPVDRAGTGAVARTCTESTTTCATSSASAVTRRLRITRRSRPHSPSLVQIVNLRRTVDFDSPRHGGGCRHAHPVVNTWTIAANTASSSRFAVPPPCGPHPSRRQQRFHHIPQIVRHDPTPPGTPHARPDEPTSRPPRRTRCKQVWATPTEFTA